MKRFMIDELEGKTIKDAAVIFDPHQEQMIVNFTDGTSATVTPYPANENGPLEWQADWPGFSYDAISYELKVNVTEETE